jgi:hypothetical protein
MIQECALVALAMNAEREIQGDDFALGFGRKL